MGRQTKERLRFGFTGFLFGLLAALSFSSIVQPKVSQAQGVCNICACKLVRSTHTRGYNTVEGECRASYDAMEAVNPSP